MCRLRADFPSVVCDSSFLSGEHTKARPRVAGIRCVNECFVNLDRDPCRIDRGNVVRVWGVEWGRSFRHSGAE